MDAYYAPYTGSTLATGLDYFALSTGLIPCNATFTINGSESVNLVAVLFVSIALLAIQRRVYEHWLKDTLESLFILNLGIFSVVTFYLNEESKDDNI
jgi:hypothetical protein